MSPETQGVHLSLSYQPGVFLIATKFGQSSGAAVNCAGGPQTVFVFVFELLWG